MALENIKGPDRMDSQSSCTGINNSHVVLWRCAVQWRYDAHRMHVLNEGVY